MHSNCCPITVPTTDSAAAASQTSFSHTTVALRLLQQRTATPEPPRVGQVALGPRHPDPRRGTPVRGRVRQTGRRPSKGSVVYPRGHPPTRHLLAGCWQVGPLRLETFQDAEFVFIALYCTFRFSSYSALHQNIFLWGW